MFKRKVARSFRKARKDIESIKHSQDMIKINANDWIQYLQQQDSFMKSKIIALEKRVQELEKGQELKVMY